MYTSFENRFNRNKKIFNIFFYFFMCLVIIITVASVFLGYHLLFNPEKVGAFFGEIVKGFNNTLNN